MNYDELLNAATRNSLCLVELVRPGERIQVVSTARLRRAHTVSPRGVRSRTPQSEGFTLLGLAHDGRDVHIGQDGLAAHVGVELVSTARELAPHGRAYRDRTPSWSPHRWDRDRFLDQELGTNPAGALTELQAKLTYWATETAHRQCLDMKVVKCAVTEHVTAEAFASSDGSAVGFAQTWSEVRVLYELEKGGRTLRLWASRHTGRLQDLHVEDLTVEAAWRGGALLAPVTDERSADDLVLSPRPSATVLRVLVQDMVEREQPMINMMADLPCSLVDDPHAALGGHSRPFDHEGISTQATVLLDRHGRRTELNGNAVRSAASLTPEYFPSNVRLEADPFDVPVEYTGLLGYGTRGEGTQGMRAGDRITFRVDVARVQQGEVVSRNAPVVFSATALDILSAITGANAALCYFPWRDYSTAGSWLRLTPSFAV
ncbi:hypothetical protein E1292_12675 [Nonomuraea deserti]|uniref:TldD/PmbA family protein n=1 Tax=Nonomuraea deserti TaxID=1848322 RepID=A0A4R4VRC3_9ACTN|nr:hypothetical protein [Nonomuraea deserti]TDD07741.1 hypothetical protein E1292_12675 [Nonomuraea deserti]